MSKLNSFNDSTKNVELLKCPINGRFSTVARVLTDQQKRPISQFWRLFSMSNVFNSILIAISISSVYIVLNDLCLLNATLAKVYKLYTTD